MWNVSQYERYRDERARPFFELLQRVPDTQVQRAVDLGCGTGELTRAIAERWPEATVLGVDSSPDMLAAARPRSMAGRLGFAQGDVRTFAGGPFDLVVSNATLQWVPDHPALLPRIAALVAPGGTLAVQMPGNFDAPSHTLLAEVVAAGPWAAKLAAAGAAGARAVRPVAWYVETLWPLGFEVDAWETTYVHVLPGEDAVLEWTKGTAMRPLLAALEAAEREAFLLEYGARLRRAYPAGPRGTLFPFRRVFFVARRTPHSA
jgi:trans-aconitate 2-methyltransferase